MIKIKMSRMDFTGPCGKVEIFIHWQDEQGRMRRTCVKRIYGVVKAEAEGHFERFRELNPSLQSDGWWSADPEFL